MDTSELIALIILAFVLGAVLGFSVAKLVF